MSSGGHNRKNMEIGRYTSIDSFELKKPEFINKKLSKGNLIFYNFKDKVLIENNNQKLYYIPQKTGFGIRYFFRCFNCGKKFQKLYYRQDIIACRKCLSLNYGSSMTSGNYVEKYTREIYKLLYELNYKWTYWNHPFSGDKQREFPIRFHTAFLGIEKPKYMRCEKFSSKMMKLENCYMKRDGALYNIAYKAYGESINNL